MEWRTRVTELLGCRYPIIQGAYAGFGISRLAAPVSEAGGFGIITAGALRTPERLREDIRRARSLTDKPFGVNLSVGICPHIDEMREVAIEEGVRAVFTSVYDAREHGRRVKEAGLVWIHKVATLKHALAAERQGADAVVMVGIEGAGEKSAIQITTLINLTMAARQLSIPVIAAGGIGDARGFLGALSLGAEGVYLGTAFMATKECPISDRYKQGLVDGDPYDEKIRTRTFAPPDPARDIRLRRREAAPAANFPADWADPLQVYDEGRDMRISGGSMAVGVIDKVVTCRELIDNMISGAEAILSGDGLLGKIVSSRPS